MTKLNERETEDLVLKKQKLVEDQALLVVERNKLNEKIFALSKKIKNIDEILDDRMLSKDDPASLLDIFPETEARRKRTAEYLESLSLGYAGSYWSGTQQCVARIMLYRNDDEHTKNVYEGVLKLLPYIKPLHDGLKRIHIFEHTLSYHTSYELAYDEKTEEFFIITSRNERYYTSKNLMDVLKRIQKYHYYEEENPYKK